MVGWIKATEELPIIKRANSRVELPIYVMLDNGEMTIADFTKSKFKEGDEWVGNYKPIWICRQRGIDINGTEVDVKYWQRLPKPF